MEYNILDFGAVADGATVNTAAIQNAIDKCHQAGGGRVIVPAGGTFVSGTIYLKSNVELYLEHGACLKASTNMADYNSDDAYPENHESIKERWTAKHFIICVRQKNVAITGGGTLDGSGDFFFEDPKPFEPTNSYSWMFGMFNVKDDNIRRPGQMLAIIDSENIKISGVEIVNSPCWTVFLHGCRYAQITGVRIFNKVYHENTDGIDIDVCENVTVSDCMIKTGDDCITLRCAASRLTNGMDTCKNISITNCVLECSVCAFRIGVGVGKIRNATISNITVSRCGSVFNFMTSYSGRGEAFIENINIANITAEKAGMALNIESPVAGGVKDVSITNFRAHLFSAVKIVAKEKGMVSNINCTDMHLISENADFPVGDREREFRGSYLIYGENADNLTFTNTIAEVREAFLGKWEGIKAFKNCDGVTINGGNIGE
ncbi:MAG: hypothetical protein IJD83_03920 [Clostridia bacterium]|nr:hypothetical protein [Clostridia bacterium]